MSPADAHILRYVVLRHEGIAEPHFDLMFETAPGSMLATWRSAEWPIATGTPIEHLADHRREYLDYEGPVSGNRGFVRRVACGTHIVRSNDPALLVVELDARAVLRLPLNRVKTTR
jgi:hypothetical protein